MKPRNDEKRIEKLLWNALKCLRSNTWLILDAIESKARTRTLQRWQNLFCCAQGRCGSCLGNGVIHLSYTHRSKQYASIVHHCSWSSCFHQGELVGESFAPGWCRHDWHRISSHLHAFCWTGLCNDEWLDIQIQDKTGKLHQVMLLAYLSYKID